MNTIEEVTLYKNLELSLRREVWRLDLSPLHISLGRLFPTVTVREESMLVPQICVYETLSFRMWVPVWSGWRLGCQQGWELSNAEWWLGPSHDDPLEVPSQSVPALPKNTTGTAVYFLGCHHCAGHFLVFGASYAGGKHRLEHVDITMYFYGEIRQCTCWQWKLLLVWLTVSRVGDIHWRLIAGSWHFNMWMEGHPRSKVSLGYFLGGHQDSAKKSTKSPPRALVDSWCRLNLHQETQLSSWWTFGVGSFSTKSLGGLLV